MSKSKEDVSISGFMTFEEKIKIKRQARKAISPSTCQKLIPTIVKPKEIWAMQTVKPTSKAKNKITLLPKVKDVEVLITQLTQLLSKD